MQDNQNQQNLNLKVQQVGNILEKRILGQSHLVNRMLMAVFCGGHILVEGAPGLAKTRAIRELSKLVEGDFKRIQFTPDLLPTDITGSEIFRPADGSFVFQRGPIFHNLILADEINRAPAKVQSALLEAMAEKQVSVGGTTYDLPDLFMVMATQNPIEQEGTYPLPEAQLDRFLLHINVGYPDTGTEKHILEIARNEARQDGDTKTDQDENSSLTQEDILSIRKSLLNIHMADPVEEYIVQLVLATRNPGQYSPELENHIEYGVSPRGSISLDRCARAHAWMSGNDFVTPDNVQSVAHDCLRHRMLLSFEAEANGITPDDVISELINKVPVG
jgi:MoxR-like ATPase